MSHTALLKRDLTYWRTAAGMKPTTKRLRKRPDDDFFPTPDRLCQQAVKLIEKYSVYFPRMLDPGCGAGPWGRALKARWPDSTLVGVEVNADRIVRARGRNRDGKRVPGWPDLLGDYDFVLNKDILSTRFPWKFDLIVGNPPFGSPEERNLAEMIIHHALDNLLAANGQMLLLLRSSFTSSRTRYDNLFSKVAGKRPYAVYALVERPSFTQDGKTDATDYSLFHWDNRRTVNYTRLEWLSWQIRQRKLF